MSLGLPRGPDAAAPRARIYAKPQVSRADLQGLLETCGPEPDEAFCSLVADVATDLLVHQADPPKYVSQADADWIIGALAAPTLGHRAKLAALLSVIRYAASAPASIAEFCVAEIAGAIVEGRPGRPSGPVTAQDTQALREAAFAPVEGSNLHVTRSCAEQLFRIAQATAAGANAPEFDEFFAKAVGNHLMGIAFHWTPSASEEREKERWLDAKPEDMKGFVSEMLSEPIDGGLDWRGGREIDEDRLRAENEADSRELALAAAIDPAETDWLMSRLSRPGALTPSERALLTFLQREATSLPAQLSARMTEAA